MHPSRHAHVDPESDFANTPDANGEQSEPSGLKAAAAARAPILWAMPLVVPPVDCFSSTSWSVCALWKHD